MEIRIVGETGEGKSSVALLIAETLRDHGFTQVTVTDEELARSFYVRDKQNIRLQAIKGNPIRIHTVNRKIGE